LGFKSDGLKTKKS